MDNYIVLEIKNFMQPMRRLGRLSVSPLGFEREREGGEGCLFPMCSPSSQVCSERCFQQHLIFVLILFGHGSWGS